MGYALPAAIGAALCSPGVPVIAFTGDGGLGMTLMEIETAVRLGLPVIVIVFNDSALSLIKIKQRASGQGGDEAVGYGPTSFAAAAEAMGAAAATVGDRAELADALTAALGRDGPTLIDATVDPAGYPALLDLTRGSTGRHSSRSWGDSDPHKTRKLRTRARRGRDGSTGDLGSGSRRAGHRRGRARLGRRQRAPGCA
jgi:thiamine pyrophosphate-dependent acetolactate synthase large subunit-like protein